MKIKGVSGKHMLIKDALEILSSRSKLILKMVLVTFIVLVIALAIVNTTLNARLSNLYREIKEANISEHIGRYFDTLSSDEENKALVEHDVQLVKNLFSAHKGAIRDSILIISFFFILMVFIVNIFSFNITAQYYEFMTAERIYKFSTLWIKYLKEAVKYSLVRMLVGLPFLILEWTLIAVLAKAAFSVSVIFSFAIGIWMFIILDALRIVLFSQMGPIILDQKVKTFKALALNFKTNVKKFSSEFAYFVVLYIFTIPLIAVTTIFTLGIGLPFILTFSILLFHILPVIFLFRNNKKPYFVALSKVSKNYDEILEI